MVNDVIQNLKNKTSDIKQVPVKVLKFSFPVICESVAIIFNKSLTFGHFLDDMKIANMAPILKGKDTTDPYDYRPIFILPTFSKVFEKLFINSYEFLCNKSILLNKQYGFRTKMSTVQAIIEQIQYLYDTINVGNVIFSLFLDFRNAFDTVNTEILLSKLHYCEIRGTPLAWFNSYLSNKI